MEEREYSDPDDMYNEAILLLNDGGDADLKRAAELLTKACEEEHLPSKRVMGFLYLDGKGVERDLKKAYDMISEAAGVLDPVAMYALGGMYERGLAVEQNDREALFYYAFAAEMGIPGAEDDADRIYTRLSELRSRRLRSRPILNLEISDQDVEAVCCKKMYDAVLDDHFRVVETYKGTELVGDDENGLETICTECPFCGKSVKRVSKDKIY
ncbi:Sel1 repeat protein [Candidatus Methanoplasma termitum]|uniref:Sel1 repeat protein n=1 Tax=Candidatus Methanoplasma termitum TaxID=1577791 RepID=A0A0A7LBD9_9ARCH|nr:tetratricopeptide repeat protein [Candidatus Methanoplasma termitum]AIZ56333.1 Sel1 repeat protein [Candidatus Methanoplasma termitum]